MNAVAAVFSLSLILQAPAGPSGTIEGVVCQIDGCQPIAGARISLELPNSSEKRTVISSENGAFHFSQLPAGRYELQAEAKDFNPVAVMPLIALANGGRAEDITVYMRALGSISGRAIDENGRPLPMTHVAALALQTDIHLATLGPVATTVTDEGGEFHLTGLSANEYLIQIKGEFPPTFHPATTNPDAADRIVITGGTRVTGIEIKRMTRGVRVSGRFVNETGEPARASAYLIPRMAASPISRITFGSEDMNPTFQIRGVPPGSYYLYAVSDFKAPPQWVRFPVDIADKDIENLTVRMTRTGSINGRVLFAPDATNTQKIDLSKVVIRLTSHEMTPPARSWNTNTVVSKTGEFQFVHIPEKTFFLDIGPPNDEWFISRLLFEGRDVTTSGFSASPEEDRTLEVIISNAGGNVAGTIKDVQDKPAAGARVVLLPDPSLRHNPAFLRVALAADFGEFSMEMIPPGNYTAIAFPAEEQFTPMFLTEVRWVEQYERYGQPIHIDAGETSRADLVTVTPERQ